MTIYFGEGPMFSKCILNAYWNWFDTIILTIVLFSLKLTGWTQRGLWKHPGGFVWKWLNKFRVPMMHSNPVAEGLYIWFSCLYKIQALHSEVSLEWYLVYMYYAENLEPGMYFFNIFILYGMNIIFLPLFIQSQRLINHETSIHLRKLNKF